MSRGGSCTHEIVAAHHHFEVGDGVHVTDVVLLLTYDRADPYAITMVFVLDSGDVTWLVARELLSRGVEDSAGEGDVRVATTAMSDGDLTVLTLRVQDRWAGFTVATDDLIQFLLETEHLVPIGCESGVVQRGLDRELRDNTRWRSWGWQPE